MTEGKGNDGMLVRWVEPKGVAAQLGVHVEVVRRWCRDGKVDARELLPGGAGWRVRMVDGWPVKLDAARWYEEAARALA